PWIFLLYLKFLQRETKRIRVFLIILISFVLLIDTLILPSLIFGMVCLFLAKTGWQGIKEKIKKTSLLLFLSIMIATLWYTPIYWLAILGTPSWAGKGLSGLIFWILQILPTTLAFILAIFSVKVFKEKNLPRDFLFYWLFVFGFLTLTRFLSDIDFWLDWTAYTMELQLGISLGLSLLLRRFFKNTFSVAFLAIYFFIFLFIFNTFVLKTMQKDIKKTVEYQIGEELTRIVGPNERAFLSGTTVFWLNAFFDINQVRGGQDQVVVDQNWRKAAWKIRQGQNPSKISQWLRKLKINYLVVHTENSREYYHDFVHPEIFDKISSLEKIYDVAGDRIYRVLE
ncbi:MAG: energy-coupling factor transporter transmembrane protein EcfT, partial [Patescibacteria group bacterium]|nr:energy-coupling factor transporter transmembrane protein EcfT [Patescibacteria group bacterium]